MHRLVRPVNYCRGCGEELHHLGALFCKKDDCQAIRKSWRHLRHNAIQKRWRSAHLERWREIDRQSHQRHKEEQNTRMRARYWANPAVRAYYCNYSKEYHRKKVLA